MNFSKEQINDYNTGFKEGFEAGNNMLSISATKIDDIRNFLAAKGKYVFYEYGYLKGYFIGHKIIKNENINITSKGNFDINTLTSDDIQKLIENKMNNKSDDDDDDDIKSMGFEWSEEELKFVKEEERKQNNPKRRRTGGKSKRTRKSKKSKRTRKSKKSKK